MPILYDYKILTAKIEKYLINKLIYSNTIQKLYVIKKL